MFESPWLFSSEDPVEDSSVDHSTIQAKVVMERWPYVSDRMQLLPHPWLLQVIRILRYVEPCSDSKRININLLSSMHSTKLSIRNNVENLDEPTSSWFLYAGVFPSWVLITVGLWLDTICLLSNFEVHIYIYLLSGVTGQCYYLTFNK